MQYSQHNKKQNETDMFLILCVLLVLREDVCFSNRDYYFGEKFL